MQKNPFGRTVDCLQSNMRKFPLFSTWSAAFILSFLWTFAWVIVFFLTTWLLDLKTSPADLVVVFWASIAAEAIIRWAENTNFVAAISKPHEQSPMGDNQDFRLVKASFILMCIVVSMFLLREVLVRTGSYDGSQFLMGQNGEHTTDGFKSMLTSWYVVSLQTSVFFPMLLGTVFRAIIYKRSHLPRVHLEE